MYGFGNTEESLQQLIYGHKRRGLPNGKPLDHTTGIGWVRLIQGQYADALNKGVIVHAIIVESTGGVAPASLAVVRRLARRSTGAGAIDRTVYGTTRLSTQSYYTHHTQQLSKAAVTYDAKAILKAITSLKQKTFGGVTPAADAAANDAQA